MKRFLFGIVIWGLVLTLLALLLPGCADGPSVQDQLVRALNDALRDGVVTEAEKSNLVALLAQSASQINWPLTLLTSAGSVASALLGVKFIPSRLFQGPFDPQAPK